MFKTIKVITLVFSFIATSVFAAETPQISQHKLLTALKAPKKNIIWVTLLVLLTVNISNR